MIGQLVHNQLGSNCNVVMFGSALTILFSYRTAVAFHVSGSPIKYIKVSPTTSKHITKFKEDYLNVCRSEEVEDNTEFTTLLNAAIIKELQR